MTSTAGLDHNGVKIETASLFPLLAAKLVEALRSLEKADWKKPTRCPQWDVKDVAAHLLGTALQRLALQRDGERGQSASRPPGFRTLVRRINSSNANWVSAWKPISPRVIVSLIERIEPELSGFLSTLPPIGKAFFPVAWAGEKESSNWFDVAREYTDRASEAGRASFPFRQECLPR